MSIDDERWRALVCAAARGVPLTDADAATLEDTGAMSEQQRSEEGTWKAFATLPDTPLPFEKSSQELAASVLAAWSSGAAAAAPTTTPSSMALRSWWSVGVAAASVLALFVGVELSTRFGTASRVAELESDGPATLVHPALPAVASPSGESTTCAASPQDACARGVSASRNARAHTSSGRHTGTGHRADATPLDDAASSAPTSQGAHTVTVLNPGVAAWRDRARLQHKSAQVYTATTAVAPDVLPRALEPRDELARAQALSRSGKVNESIAVYRELMLRFPTSPEASAAQVSVGQIELRRGNAEAALHLFERYLRHAKGPLAQEAAYGRIRALRVLGRTSEETLAAAAFLRRYPQSVYSARLQPYAGD